MATTDLAPARDTRIYSPVQAKKGANSIAWIAPLVCLLSGFLIWRFIIGSDSNFNHPDPGGGFWPKQEGPKSGLARMYQGGIIVPVLIGALLMVITFVVERFLAIGKAAGKGDIASFIRKIQYQLSDMNIDMAIAECGRQKGSVGNVMRAGLLKYKDMITSGDLDKDQKVLAIRKEIEESVSLEMPALERNIVFLSTIASVATLMGLLGTVIGMITSFAALGDSGGGEAAQRLSQGISEALYNTALGIGTSAISIVMYNIFTTKIDAIMYGIDESGFTLTQSYETMYK
jgi:biopolymer transport protein ExbB